MFVTLLRIFLPIYQISGVEEKQFSSSFNKITPVVKLQQGKLPPQVLDFEEVVLGAMMIDKKGVDEVIDILHPEAFYSESHNLIFTAMAAQNPMFFIALK